PNALNQSSPINDHDRTSRYVRRIFPQGDSDGLPASRRVRLCAGSLSKTRGSGLPTSQSIFPGRRGIPNDCDGGKRRQESEQGAGDPASTRRWESGGRSLPVRQKPGDLGAAVVHIFKFEGNLIVELWDMGQAVPEDSPNENGMF